MVYTPMVYSRGMSEELRDQRRRRSLLQVEGTGWDIGNGVLYLASEEARWVTGIVLPIDAGATAGSGRLPVPKSHELPRLPHVGCWVYRRELGDTEGLGCG